ncbi:phosphoribosylamine--glycine ligase [Microbacterium sp.]|uniref:phosphoribosylamine--glycine ligase n=1 Tax=Microbacterium sp. TaxID=51671 RepID=UPI003F9C920B
MEVAALAIAILSLVLAGLALGWQVAAWALDGPRLRATLQHGVLGRGGVVVSTVGRNSKLRDMSSMREQGWNGPDVIAVLVTNQGRSRAKITRFGIQLQRGGMSVQYPEGNTWSPQLPYWLEPGESATWYAELQDARALMSATRQSVRSDAGGVFMTIETGTGKTLRTRRLLELR